MGIQNTVFFVTTGLKPVVTERGGIATRPDHPNGGCAFLALKQQPPHRKDSYFYLKFALHETRIFSPVYPFLRMQLRRGSISPAALRPPGRLRRKLARKQVIYVNDKTPLPLLAEMKKTGVAITTDVSETRKNQHAAFPKDYYTRLVAEKMVDILITDFPVEVKGYFL